jgi:hypothetical protein
MIVFTVAHLPGISSSPRLALFRITTTLTLL